MLRLKHLGTSAKTYRKPVIVNVIVRRANGDLYPLCPRCNNTVEREYQAFCVCCGQKLDWRMLSKAVIMDWKEV